jgi:cation diffusion facilitator family transporter
MVNTTKTPTRTRNIRRVLIGLLFANLVVVVAKFAIGLSTQSLAVIGDGVHASVDAMNNVLALILIRIAAQGPDEDHPYGHTKFETLGALAIVVFLSISGFELVKGAVNQLLTESQPVNITNLQFAVLVGTLIVNAIVATYESKKGHELHSDLLLADAAHTKADVFITLGVLIAVGFSRAGVPWVDPLVALAVAGVIVVIAYGIVARSVPILVDQHVVPAADIVSALAGVEGVERVYAIRSRRTAEQRFAELTIAVEKTATVDVAHQIADSVESRLQERLSFDEIVVHIEPC